MAASKPEPTIIDGKPYFNISNAAKYLGVSTTSIHNILKRRKEITVLQRGFGNEKFVSKDDLDELMKTRPVS